MGTPSECAVTITAPRQVECREMQRPHHPLAPNEVEGRTLASLVSPGTELNWYYDPAFPATQAYPVTPGYAAVFEVERVGSDVHRIRPGDRVLDPSGRHRSWQRSGADQLLVIPEHLPAATATFARLMAVSMATLSTTAARPPEAIGVSGLGLVGHLATKIMAAAGYSVTAWDSDAGRRNLLALPTVRVVERAPVPAGHALDDPDAAGQLSLVVECRGSATAVVESCGAVRRGGEVVLVGVPWRSTSNVTAHELLRIVFHRYVTLRSGWEYQVPDEPTDFVAASTKGNLKAALTWLSAGRVVVDGLASEVKPEMAAEAYAAMSARSWPTLSTIFDWT